MNSPCQPHLLGLMAHDLAGTRSRDRTRRDERNHRDFHVEIVPNRGGNLSCFGKRPGIFDFGDDRQRRFAVFLDLERGDAVVPDQAGCLLDDVLNVMRVIVLPAENNHVLDAAADVEFAVVEESQVAGAKVAVVIGSIVHQPRAELLQSQFGIIPVASALAASGNPDFADALWLESEMALRIHDLDVETPESGVPQLTICVAPSISETSVVMRALPRARARLLTETMLRPPSETARVFSASP